VFHLLLKKEGKKDIIIWSTQAVSILISISTGKVIATNFKSSDFGQYSLILSFYFLITGLFFNPIQQFFSTEVNKNNHNDFLITYCIILSFLNSFFFLFASAFCILFRYNYYLDIFLLLISSLGQSAMSLMVNLSNIQRRYLLNSIALTVPLVLNLAIILFQNTATSNTYIALLIAMSLSNLFSSIILYYLYFSKTEKNINLLNYKKNIILFFKHVRKLLNFAIPLALLSISNWFSSYFDRFIIYKYMARSDVGIYAANYGLASKVIVLSTPIMILLRADIYDPNISIQIKKKIIWKKIITFALIGLVASIILLLFKNQIGNLFLSQNYTDGFFILAPISIAYVLLGCIQFFDLFFYYTSKTTNIFYVYTFGMLLNVILSMSLIPSFGLWGACEANILSYLFQFILASYLFSNTIIEESCIQ